MTTVTPAAARLAAYLSPLLDSFQPGSAIGRKLGVWLHANGALAGIDFRAATGSRGAAARPLSAAAWAGLRQAAAKSAAAPVEDGLAQNLAVFAQCLALDPVDLAILGFVLETDRDWRLQSLCKELLATNALDAAELVGLAIVRSPAELRARLRQGPLGQLGLVVEGQHAGHSFSWQVPYRIRCALLPPAAGLADIERQLIGTALPPALAEADFATIAAEYGFVVRLLDGALRERRRGVNILVYGPPGTGKSEFCKSVAAAAGCALFAVGEADEDGEELCRDGRLDALSLAERLAQRRSRALLLFDEMEDVLQYGERSAGSGIRRAGSKVFFNRLLERNAVPVLWTSNAIDEFDPAFLRRMSFALELKTPPSPSRAPLWRRLAGRRGLALAEAAAEDLARRYDVAPSLMSSAAEAVALAQGGAGELDFVVAALGRTLGIGTRVRDGGMPSGAFRLDLVNADVDLAALAASLARPDCPRDYALCLYGPPGTGKSAFARHLAESAALPVLLKRGSDLLSPWVGQSERRIADAFEEARRTQAALIIDEAEGFLWSRDGAGRSWEVSMVNELLVAMERHTLPFICTTNYLELIDPAALRRFSFKIKFDALTPAQVALAYRQFFDRAAPPALARLDGLTPGDFAVVAKRLRITGAGGGEAAILAELQQELAVKNRGKRRIGF
jgi:transitional endoplasmic reticulum ATPase